MSAGLANTAERRCQSAAGGTMPATHAAAPPKQFAPTNGAAPRDAGDAAYIACRRARVGKDAFHFPAAAGQGSISRAHAHARPGAGIGRLVGVFEKIAGSLA